MNVGKTEKICSIAALERIFEIFSPEAESTEIAWWRGHAKSNWHLVPKLYRTPSKDFHKRENFYLNHFQGRALPFEPHQLLPKDKMEWICLGQHFGLPTRLQDWSESPLVALYFALHPEIQCKPSDVQCQAKEYEDADACLWRLYPSKLNEETSQKANPKKPVQGLLAIDSERAQTMANRAFGVVATNENEMEIESTLPEILALQPWESNARIVAQQGRFTIHRTPEDMQKLVGEGILKQFVIARELKEPLRAALKTFGIRRWNIYPDLEGLARGLAEEEPS